MLASDVSLYGVGCGLIKYNPILLTFHFTLLILIINLKCMRKSIQKLISNKSFRKLFQGMSFGLGIVIIVVAGIIIVQAQSVGPYGPGDTLNPSCSPGDPGCYVDFSLFEGSYVTQEELGSILDSYLQETEWPAGNYCIVKPMGQACPAGFSEKQECSDGGALHSVVGSDFFTGSAPLSGKAPHCYYDGGQNRWYLRFCCK